MEYENNSEINNSKVYDNYKKASKLTSLSNENESVLPLNKNSKIIIYIFFFFFLY